MCRAREQRASSASHNSVRPAKLAARHKTCRVSYPYPPTTIEFRGKRKKGNPAACGWYRMYGPPPDGPIAASRGVGTSFELESRVASCRPIAGVPR
eukprot:3991097-Prymnesium_polylepis.1